MRPQAPADEIMILVLADAEPGFQVRTADIAAVAPFLDPVGRRQAPVGALGLLFELPDLLVELFAALQQGLERLRLLFGFLLDGFLLGGTENIEGHRGLPSLSLGHRR